MDDPRKRQTGPERRSKEGDRGHKKTLPTNGGKVNTPDRHLRSTEGQIATKAKTSRRKVSETVRVLQHGTPELIDKMLAGCGKTTISSEIRNPHYAESVGEAL